MTGIQARSVTGSVLAAPPVQPQRVDVLVVLGTDCHPFDRLVRWIDAWVAAQGPGYRSVVQHGYTSAPERSEGRRLVAHEEMQSLIALADVVVMHGGPASIMEARQVGKVPIVVARDPRYGEHVDGHQLRFTRRLADLNLIRLCEEEQAFTAALHAAQSDPSVLKIANNPDATMTSRRGREGAREAARIIKELVATRRGRPFEQRIPRQRREG